MIIVYIMLKIFSRKKNALTTVFIVRAFKIIYKVILCYAPSEYCTVAAVTPPELTAFTYTTAESYVNVIVPKSLVSPPVFVTP